MPRVPEERAQVAQAPIPGVRVEAQVTPQQLGAGVAGVTQELGLSVYGRAVREANQTALMAADRVLAESQTRLQVRISEMHGKDAFDAPDVLDSEWGKAVTTIEHDLITNDQQRQAFHRAADERYGHLNKATQFHVSTEKTVYQDGETDAYLKASRDAARLNAADAEAVKKELGRQEAVLREWAQRKGLGKYVHDPELAAAHREMAVLTGGTYREDDKVWSGSPAYDQRLAEQRSGTHTEVIKGFLYTGQDLSAKKYYEAHKDQFTAEHRDGIEKVLEEGSYRGEAQRSVRTWIGEGKDMAQMLDAVNKIDDPKSSQLARELVKQHFADQNAARKQNLDEIYDVSKKLVDQAIGKQPGREVNPRIVIGPDAWMALTTAEQGSLRQMAHEALHQADRVNDDLAWFKFHSELSHEDVAKLSPREYRTQYRDKFSNVVRAAADGYYNEVRNAANKAEAKDPALTATQSFKDQAEDSFRVSGLLREINKPQATWTEDERKMYVRFEREAAAAIEQEELANKKKLTPSEKQVVIDGVVDRATKKVWVERGWFGFKSEVPAIGLEEDEKGRAQVPLEKIPKDWDAEARNYLKSENKTVTNDKLRRAYAQRVLGNSAAVKTILDE